MYEIKKELWATCKICGLTIQEMKSDFGGKGKYLPQAFKHHINNTHSLTIEDYFEKYCNLTAPPCKCGQCDKKSYVVKFASSRIRWKEIVCGRNEGQQKWSEAAKITRRGEGNPMFGQVAWNAGHTKETCPQMKKLSESRIGMKLSEETKNKIKAFQSVRLVHGHTGHKHSEATKEILRQKTSANFKKGVFKQTKSKPHVAFSVILTELGIKFEEEQHVEYWSFDFYLPEYNIYVEVDGDYWHSNPKIYPNGPKSNGQKINWCRDLKKNKYCLQHEMKLLRFWECDILNTPELIKEQLCNLKELSPVEKSA